MNAASSGFAQQVTPEDVAARELQHRTFLNPGDTASNAGPALLNISKRKGKTIYARCY